MTSPRHLRGTAFCEEKKKNEQQIIVVNLQCIFSDNFRRFMQKCIYAEIHLHFEESCFKRDLQVSFILIVTYYAMLYYQQTTNKKKIQHLKRA